MRCEFFSNAGGFLDVAGEFLVENEAENTVLLGHARRCMHRPRSDAVMAAAQDGDASVRPVAMMIPPHALVLSARGPEGIPRLVEALRAAGIGPPGVVRVEPMAERFAALWRGRESPMAEAEMRTILDRGRSHRCRRGTSPAAFAPHPTTISNGWPRGSAASPSRRA